MRRYAVVLTIFMAAGCDEPDIRTAHYAVKFDDFAGRPVGPTYLVLAGTRLCESDGSCTGECPRGEKATCALLTREVLGAAQDPNGCFVVGQEPVTWKFTPSECTSPRPSESAVLTSVGVSGVETRLVLPWISQLELLAEGQEIDWRAVGAQVPAASEFEGPIGVFAGEYVHVVPVLVEMSSGRNVGYNWSDLQVSAEALSGTAPIVDTEYKQLSFTAELGARFAAAMEISGQRWLSPEFVAVGEDGPAELELTARVFKDKGFVVEALVRDKDGRIILGTPISWRDLAGEFVISSGANITDGQGDHAEISDDCVAPTQRDRPRHTIVEARYGELSATLEIELKNGGPIGPAPGEEPTDEGWVKPIECFDEEVIDEGCGCRSSDGAAGWMLMGVVPWLVRRRRRSVQA